MEISGAVSGVLDCWGVVVVVSLAGYSAYRETDGTGGIWSLDAGCGGVQTNGLMRSRVEVVRVGCLELGSANASSMLGGEEASLGTEGLVK